MTLYQRLEEYISAAFTGIWITSHEQSDALAEIARLCQDRQWRLASWDLDRGLVGHSADTAGGNANSATAGDSNMAADPVAALRSLNALAHPDSSALLVLPNFHRLLQSAQIVQALAHQIQQGKHLRCFYIVLAPLVQIPIELEKHFVILEHDLSDQQQLLEIARAIATQEGELPGDLELQRLLEAAAGLTRLEAEGAFSLSLVREQRLLPQSVWELKEGMLKKSGLLQLHRGRQSFADLGGLWALKDFCTRALRPRAAPAGAKARGVMLLSPPGCGKSAFAKALGQELSRPTLILEVGALMGSLVGQSEERTRQALRLVDAMSPCILFIDEVDKALAGLASGGSGGGGGGGGGGGDSGVLARLFGCLLSWLSDHESEVFVVCTANDISKLPPEFGRAERCAPCHG